MTWLNGSLQESGGDEEEDQEVSALSAPGDEEDDEVEADMQAMLNGPMQQIARVSICRYCCPGCFRSGRQGCVRQSSSCSTAGAPLRYQCARLALQGQLFGSCFWHRIMPGCWGTAYELYTPFGSAVSHTGRHNTTASSLVVGWEGHSGEPSIVSHSSGLCV